MVLIQMLNMEEELPFILPKKPDNPNLKKNLEKEEPSKKVRSMF
jgi:hypothetical protein